MIKTVVIFITGFALASLVHFFLFPNEAGEQIRKVMIAQDYIIGKENFVVKKQQFLILKRLDRKEYKELENWLLSNLNEHAKQRYDDPELNHATRQKFKMS